MSKFSRVRDCPSSIYFSYDICLWRPLPYSLHFWFCCSNHKADWNIGLIRDFLINLHEWNIQFCIFENFDSILRIIKPSIIWLHLNVLPLLLKLFCLEHCGFFTNNINWAFSTICFSMPFTFNWIHLPRLRKNFTYTNPLELLHKVREAHPPRTINFLGLWHIL